MKAITILCAIVFSLRAVWEASYLVQSMSMFPHQPIFIAGQVLALLSYCCLAAFFFMLFSRQR